MVSSNNKKVIDHQKGHVSRTDESTLNVEYKSNGKEEDARKIMNIKKQLQVIQQSDHSTGCSVGNLEMPFATSPALPSCLTKARFLML